LPIAGHQARNVNEPQTKAQRWLDGRHSWRHIHEGGFDRRRYEVAAIEEAAARPFCERHHYSHSWPASRLPYGLFDKAADDRLVGIAVLGVPMSRAVLTGPFPKLVPFEESVELSRLVLLDEVPANAESHFCAQVFAHAAREHGVRGVVMFSDPVPRYRQTDRGLEVLMPGHIGCVYQALGAAYMGRATPRSLIVLPDGTALSARARAKVTGGERGRQGVVNRLVAMGASPLHEHMDPREWMRTALAEVGARTIQHPGNHRYAFPIQHRRQRAAVGLRAFPYPKRDDRPALFDPVLATRGPVGGPGLGRSSSA
jgi:hypothetical protein